MAVVGVEDCDEVETFDDAVVVAGVAIVDADSVFNRVDISTLSATAFVSDSISPADSSGPGLRLVAVSRLFTLAGE